MTEAAPPWPVLACWSQRKEKGESKIGQQTVKYPVDGDTFIKEMGGGKLASYISGYIGVIVFGYTFYKAALL